MIRKYHIKTPKMEGACGMNDVAAHHRSAKRPRLFGASKVQMRWQLARHSMGSWRGARKRVGVAAWRVARARPDGTARGTARPAAPH